MVPEEHLTTTNNLDAPIGFSMKTSVGSKFLTFFIKNTLLINYRRCVNYYQLPNSYQGTVRTMVKPTRLTCNP